MSPDLCDNKVGCAIYDSLHDLCGADKKVNYLLLSINL